MEVVVLLNKHRDAQAYLISTPIERALQHLR